MIDDSSCSAIWQRSAQPVWGTAPHSTFWIALEEPGAWGARALTESHLDPVLGTSIEQLCADHGGRASLIRRPGRHPWHPGSRSVLVATGLATGAPRLWQGQVASAHEVLDLPWTSLAGEVSELAGFAPAPPQLLVCTNGTRDVCCALLGRPLAVSADAIRPGQVWESSHLHGHRFSPTVLVLPAGYSLGHFPEVMTGPVLDAAKRGELASGVVGGLRGRLGLVPAAQVVDAQLRASTGESGLAPWHLVVTEVDADAWDVTSTVSGHLHVHRVTRTSGPDERPLSCGKASEPVVRWTIG